MFNIALISVPLNIFVETFSICVFQFVNLNLTKTVADALFPMYVLMNGIDTMLTFV